MKDEAHTHLFDSQRNFRDFHAKAISRLNSEEWDFIPPIFNNNIRWQVAHIITTTDLLCYRLAGKEIPLLTKEFIKGTSKGSDPKDGMDEKLFSQSELLILLTTTAEQLEKDKDELSNSTYEDYRTSSEFVIDSFEKALSFAIIHEAWHFGNIMAIRKLLKGT